MPNISGKREGGEEPVKKTREQLRIDGATKAGERLIELRERSQGEELKKALLEEIMFIASLYSDPARQDEGGQFFHKDLAEEEVFVAAARTEGASDLQIIFALACNFLSYEKMPDTKGDLTPSGEELQTALNNKNTTKDDLKEAIPEPYKNLV
jgi:hypothetical protein